MMQPQPDPIESLISRAVQRARDCLVQQPPCYRFHSNMVYDSTNHRIKLHFRPNNGQDRGQTIEIDTGEPDLRQALKIKQRLQSRILKLPGIDIYRDKAKKGEFNPELDELFPHNPPTRTRLVKRHGMFKMEFTWPEDDLRTFSLGLIDNEENRAEAQKRREYAEQYLEQVRQDHIGPEFRSDVLPLSKGDLIEATKAWVESNKREWLHSPRFEIDQFPIEFKLPFPTAGNRYRESYEFGSPVHSLDDRNTQRSWLLINSIVASGDPNPTWSLQLGIKVQEDKWAGNLLLQRTDHVVKNATAEINLHTGRRHVAERRAMHVVNAVLQEFKKQNPNAMLALNDKGLLMELSPTERANTPNIDTNRFRTAVNNIPRFRDDLEVRIMGQVPYHDKVRFKLGVFRANANIDAGQPGEPDQLPGETVWESLSGDNIPLVLERTFEVEAKQAAKIDDFARAVDSRMHEAVIEAYRPQSNAGFEIDEVEKEVRPRDFKPQTTMAIFKDAVTREQRKFPDITPLGRGTLGKDGDFRAR